MTIPGSAHPMMMASLAAEPEAYQIERSLRFNSSDSAYLSRTPASAGNRRTWTWSGWVKRTTFGTEGGIFSTYAGAHPNTSLFWEVDGLKFHDYTTSYQFRLATTEKYRDPSAWYHIVLAYDSTESTASDRAKLWVNGALQTLSGTTVPSNHQTDWNSTTQHDIGRFSAYFDGYLADVHFIDGQALDPTSFGEFNGVWKPKEYTGTYGTNGFYLPFEASDLGADLSGNGNDWTPNNFVTNTEQPVIYTADAVYTDPADVIANGQQFLSGSFTNKYVYIVTNGGGDDGVRVFDSSTGSTIGETWTWAHYLNGSWQSSGGYNDGEWALQLWSNNNNLASYRFNNSAPLHCLIPLTSAPNPTPVTGSIGVGSFNASPNTLIEADKHSVVDSPTDGNQTDTGVGGEVVGNYATLNPNNASGAGGAPSTSDPITLSDGNLVFRAQGSLRAYCSSTQTIGNKAYWEVYLNSSSFQYTAIGLCPIEDFRDIGNGDIYAFGPDSVMWKFSDGGVRKGSAAVQITTTIPSLGATVAMAFDPDTGDVYCFVEGVIQNNGNPVVTVDSTKSYCVTVEEVFATDNTINFGQQPFVYSAPAGYKVLCTTNLGEPVIPDGQKFMDAVTYIGNGAGQTISGLDFSPDLVWIKSRSGTFDHFLYDQVRGATEYLNSNLTTVETTDSNSLTAFTSDGFSLGSTNAVNQNNSSLVAWCWDAGSSTVTNNDGTIESQVRANPSAGFSICTFTKAASTNETWGHGLNAAPAMVITKERNATTNWQVWHTGLSSATNAIVLNSTGAEGSHPTLFSSAPSSSIVSMGTGWGGGNHVAYCFAPVDGYSNGFSYTGNGSTDGVFQYLGFRPRLILLKCSSTTGNWTLLDTAREGYNVDNDPLYPNLTNAEGTTDILDITSNGFKLRTTDASVNSSGATYVGFAWAELPFKTARAR